MLALWSRLTAEMFAIAAATLSACATCLMARTSGRDSSHAPSYTDDLGRALGPSQRTPNAVPLTLKAIVRARIRASGPRQLWVLVGSLLALYLVVFVLAAAGRIGRPLDEFAYGESWLLDDARRLVRSEPLYAPVDRLPITQTAYTPVYYVLVGQLQRVFGDHGYTVGRGLSLAATAAASLLIVWSVRRISGCWAPGLLAAGLFLTQNLTALLWAPLHRVDPLALAFTLGGLALFTAQRRGLAALLFVAAIMTKQTYLIAPAAACVSLWPCRREMVRFALMFALPLAACLAIAQWMTAGWFLWHTVIANSNQADFQTFVIHMGSFLQFNGLPVLAAAAAMTVPGAPGERVWRLYFVGCLVTLPSIAKIGASSNYWLELSAATAVLLALASVRLAARPELLTRTMTPLLLAGMLLFSVTAYQANGRAAIDAVRDSLWPPPAAYLSLIGDGDRVTLRVPMNFVERIAREPGELLTDNPGLAAAAGKAITYEFQIFQLLRAEGRWSDEPIIEAIRARRFALVALMHPIETPVDRTRWTPGIRDALQAGYRPSGQESGFWLYRPG